MHDPGAHVKSLLQGRGGRAGRQGRARGKGDGWENGKSAVVERGGRRCCGGNGDEREEGGGRDGVAGGAEIRGDVAGGGEVGEIIRLHVKSFYATERENICQVRSQTERVESLFN